MALFAVLMVFMPVNSQSWINAVASARVEQARRAGDVCLKEDKRVLDRPVNMALGGKIDHDIKFLLGKELVNKLPVGNIALDELKFRILHSLIKALEIARICEGVEADYIIIRVLIKHIIDEVAAYETGAARNKNFQIIHPFLHYH